ncbi:hypothetical protein [Nocardia sp. CA-119907]|uniref:hypothetical protein n=1 Tax=Nocardia sp. CA-119907 TaxID=3239973 RepID=UPI003D985E95
MSAAIPIHDSWTRLIRLWLLPLRSPRAPIRLLSRNASLLRIVVLLAVVVAVPIAGAIGSAVYSSEAARIQTEQATKFVVSATVTTPPVWTPARRFEATVQWYENGRQGIAIVRVPRSAALGKDVPIWLGPDGAPTSAPPRLAEAALAGLGASLAALAGLWLSAWLLLLAGGWLAPRQQSTGWVRQWRNLGRPIAEECP